MTHAFLDTQFIAPGRLHVAIICKYLNRQRQNLFFVPLSRIMANAMTNPRLAPKTSDLCAIGKVERMLGILERSARTKFPMH